MHKLLRKPHLLFIPHRENGYKPHALRHRSLLFYSLLLVAVKVVTTLILISVYPTEAEFSTITTNRIIELTNQTRTEQGLPALKTNEILNQAAALKAQDMVTNGYFAHTSPDKVTPWHWFSEAGYEYTYAGENLAMNFSEAEEAMTAWMNSPTHRDNIVSKNYADIGVAVAVGKINGQETTIVVQMFGKRFVMVAGEESFKPSATSEIQVPAGQQESAGQPKTGEAVRLPAEAGQQVVTLTEGEKGGWLYKFLQYSSRFFLVLTIFIIINLLLTIFIRVEIQHKPIILHSLLVIVLGLMMILLKTHFVDGLGKLIVV
jgi:uncharacterized protein YkwD